jgi:hypothetical protein
MADYCDAITEKPHNHMHVSFWTAWARTTGGKKYPRSRRRRFLIILLPLTLSFQNFVVECPSAKRYR